MSVKNKIRLQLLGIILLAFLSGAVVFPRTVKFIPPVYNFLQTAKVNLGLDLQGGYRLEYALDLSQIDKSKREEAIQAAQDVLERKVNATGTSEALIQSVADTNPPRIIIEYPGAKNAEDLKKLIKETPFLDFRTEKSEEELNELIKQTDGQISDLDRYRKTDLTGKNLKSADVVFQNQGLSEPQVSLQFDKEGAKKFAEITKNNIEKTVAIVLDGKIISAPRVQTEITNGEAVITGNFTIEEAKNLKRRLNEGALPVPIKLDGQQSVGASLGKVSLNKSIRAGLVGLGLVAIFMIAYYRFFGLVATIALFIYALMMISVFKLSGSLSTYPITLTLSGIAGFILSVGMAVDANILIFERIKEELRSGDYLQSAIDEGFRRAWPSIRDGNYSTLITSFILVWVGTGFVKGFAVVLIIGVLLSMLTAIVITKIILRATAGEWLNRYGWLIKK